MGERDVDLFPMIVVMLERPAEIGVTEVTSAVQVALGCDVAASARIVADNPGGMRYFTWACAGVDYNLGVSPDPWNINERPRTDASMQRAWDAHRAWLYVDALVREKDDSSAHLANVLRVAAHFAGRGERGAGCWCGGMGGGCRRCRRSR